MQVEQWPIENVKPYAKNPRKNDDAVEKVANSIREFGFQQPIVVDNDGVVIVGHTRLKAAQMLGLDEVPVVVASGLSDDQAKAYRLADNKTGELSQWDFDKLASELEDIDWLNINIEQFGFTLDDVDYRSDDEKVEEDDYDIDDEQESIVKVGEVWQLGNHLLMCGDSTDADAVAKLMNGEEADLLLTDPPYNVALGHHMKPSEAKQLHRRTDGLVIDNDAFDSEQEFEDFLLSSFESALPHLKQGGAFYIWHASTMTHRFRAACDRAGMNVRQILVWAKNTFALGRQDYQWQHELCLYGWKDGAAHYFIDDRTKSTVEQIEVPNLAKAKKDELLSLCKQLLSQSEREHTTVISEDKPSRSAEHPTMKPLKLMARQIHNSTLPGELVLDVFGGSGSTMMACEQMNRRCYTMEIDPHYCDVIVDRWEKMTGREASRINA